jgi:uncharacterized protein
MCRNLAEVPPSKKAPEGAAGAAGHLAYIAPFAVFLLFLAFRDWFPFGPEVEYPLRLLATVAALAVFSRGILQWKLVAPGLSILLGLGIFAVWILPDALWPAYRQHWLFSNSVMGEPVTSLPEQTRADLWFLVFRVLGTAAVVPVIEELFWRGWLMRWLIDGDVRKAPLGTYTHFSFWFTAALFATEHGPFWEVGLVAGVLFGWWVIRTRSLEDCILAHAAANAALAAYVIAYGQWQYWL